MSNSERDVRLSELKRRKRNRSLADAETVLQEWGFKRRSTSGNHVLWSLGEITVTLPIPHGGDKVLHPGFVSEVVKACEQVKYSLGDLNDADE